MHSLFECVCLTLGEVNLKALSAEPVGCMYSYSPNH